MREFRGKIKRGARKFEDKGKAVVQRSAFCASDEIFRIIDPGSAVFSNVDKSTTELRCLPDPDI